MIHAEITQDTLVELEANLPRVPVIHPLPLGVVHGLPGVLVFQCKSKDRNTTVVNLSNLDLFSSFCCALKEAKVARYHAKKFEVPLHVTPVAQGPALKLTTVIFCQMF